MALGGADHLGGSGADIWRKAELPPPPDQKIGALRFVFFAASIVHDIVEQSGHLDRAVILDAPPVGELFHIGQHAQGVGEVMIRPPGLPVLGQNLPAPGPRLKLGKTKPGEKPGPGDIKAYEFHAAVFPISPARSQAKQTSHDFHHPLCYNAVMSAHFLPRRRFSPRRRFPLFQAGFLLLGALSAAGCGTQAQNSLKVQNDLDECLRSAQLGTVKDEAKARSWADLAIAVAPSDPDTYFGPATPNPSDPLPQLSVYAVFTAVGDTPAVAGYMTQAVQKFPGDERGYIFLSDAQNKLGQTAAQKATAAKLVTLLSSKLKTAGATNIQDLTDALAQAYFDAGDTGNGTATDKKLIQAYPTEPEAMNNLAYAEAVRGIALPEALTLARQAVALAQKKADSDSTVAANQDALAEYQDTLGWVLYQQGSYSEAEQNELEAANDLPRLAEVRYHLGLIYVAEGKMDAAQSELRHATLLSQGYAAAQQALDNLPKTAVAKAP